MVGRADWLGAICVFFYPVFEIFFCGDVPDGSRGLQAWYFGLLLIFDGTSWLWDDHVFHYVASCCEIEVFRFFINSKSIDKVMIRPLNLSQSFPRLHRRLIHNNLISLHNIQIRLPAQRLRPRFLLFCSQHFGFEWWGTGTPTTVFFAEDCLALIGGSVG